MQIRLLSQGCTIAIVYPQPSNYMYIYIYARGMTFIHTQDVEISVYMFANK